jgi:hypothetical protein
MKNPFKKKATVKRVKNPNNGIRFLVPGKGYIII